MTVYPVRQEHGSTYNSCLKTKGLNPTSLHTAADSVLTEQHAAILEW